VELESTTARLNATSRIGLLRMSPYGPSTLCFPGPAQPWRRPWGSSAIRIRPNAVICGTQSKAGGFRARRSRATDRKSWCHRSLREMNRGCFAKPLLAVSRITQRVSLSKRLLMTLAAVSLAVLYVKPTLASMGDLDGDGAVQVPEVISLVNCALEEEPASTRPPASRSTTSSAPSTTRSSDVTQTRCGRALYFVANARHAASPSIRSSTCWGAETDCQTDLCLMGLWSSMCALWCRRLSTKRAVAPTAPSSTRWRATVMSGAWSRPVGR